MLRNLIFLELKKNGEGKSVFFSNLDVILRLYSALILKAHTKVKERQSRQ